MFLTRVYLEQGIKIYPHDTCLVLSGGQGNLERLSEGLLGGWCQTLPHEVS